MCWSGEASAALAVVGFAATARAAYKGEPRPLWYGLGFFSLMEALQAYTYSVIDQCGAPGNQLATLLGYIHISFQPFFINAISLYFIRKDIAEKIAPTVYVICFAACVFTLVQLYPFNWAGQCDPTRPLCGKSLCSITGSWHMAWSVPTNGIGNAFVNTWVPLINTGFIGYMGAVFFLPIIYGSWKMSVFHLVLGPTLAVLLSDSPNEQPAVWCLLSIGLLIILMSEPVRRRLHVTTGPLWPKDARAAQSELLPAPPP